MYREIVRTLTYFPIVGNVTSMSDLIANFTHVLYSILCVRTYLYLKHRALAGAAVKKEPESKLICVQITNGIIS